MEEQLIQKGTQIPSLPGTDKNYSSLVRSLLSPETTLTKVTHYWVEHLMKLGNSVTQSQQDAEKIILQEQLSDSKLENASLQEMLKKLEQKFESDLKKLTKIFPEHTTGQSDKAVPEFDRRKKILQDQLSMAKKEKVTLAKRARKQALETVKRGEIIPELTKQPELEAAFFNWKFPDNEIASPAAGILRYKMEGPAALFITSWKRNSYGPGYWKMITDFCENTLKKKSTEFSKIHCTVLDIDEGEEEKKDATRYGVTLIPASRPEWSDPLEDLPAITWLLFPETYYPKLRKLESIHHVVAFSSNVKKVAARLQERLFPGARFYQIAIQSPSALFVYDVWNNGELGLTGFHRTLVQDFCERKVMAGEDLKAYCTVLDVKISDDQKNDAESCGVTLIPAQRKETADHRDDPPKLEWLLYHEIYYPDLQKLENVQYVIGYAPKTGRAAVDIRKNLFPCAKLVFINHARPEPNCLQAEECGQSDFEEEMLRMASEADLLFSIGPSIYYFFQNAYRAEVQGRDLSDIPHEELLPRPNKCFWEKNPKERPITQHHILTCGQMDTQVALERCKRISASIGTVANDRRKKYRSSLEWKILGVSEKFGKTELKILTAASQSPYIYPTLQSGHSAKSLLTSLQQSHLCLPSPCYVDYSFYGLEAMAFGLPTAVHENSHLAHFIMKYLEIHVDDCVVRTGEGKVSEKISQHLEETPVAFKEAKAVKSALVDCEAITESFAKFALLIRGTVWKENSGISKAEDEVGYNGNTGNTSMERLSKSTVQSVTETEDTGTYITHEMHGEVTDREESESAKATTTLSESTENEQGQDSLVEVALDEEILQKHLRELEELEALSVQLRQLQERKKNEVKTAWGECEHGLKLRVQAVLADEDSCNGVKKVCKEKVGLDPRTFAAE